MTDEKRPETPEEFLVKQQDREQNERANALKAQQERSDREAKERDAKYEAIANQLIATWRKIVETASEQAGVRFVVLADLSDTQHWQNDPQVRRVVSTLAQAGWTAEVVTLTQHQAQHAYLAKPNEPQAGPVEYKHMRGWRIDGTPKFGEHFFSQRHALIVRWFQT
jgi:hypothetical protein